MPMLHGTYVNEMAQMIVALRTAQKQPAPPGSTLQEQFKRRDDIERRIDVLKAAIDFSADHAIVIRDGMMLAQICLRRYGPLQLDAMIEAVKTHNGLEDHPIAPGMILLLPDFDL